MQPSDLVTERFPRLKPDQKKALAKLGIRTVKDLLYHFPARYESGGPTGTIAGAQLGTEVTLYGTIRKPEAKKAWKSKRPMAEAWLEDASGRIKLRWFSQPYMAKMLHDGLVVKATGKVTGSASSRYLANPEIDKTAIEPEAIHENLFAAGNLPEGDTLYPVYSESKGISSLWLTHAVRKALEADTHTQLPDPLPSELVKKYNLPTLATALVWMHTPKKLADAEAARKRFAFQEVFAIQVAMQQERAMTAREESLPVHANRDALGDFIASFPFPPTAAQERAIDTIVSNFESNHPMRRLLEGDVGSGKTAVAAATAYLVATSTPPGRKSGTLQVAYMCPTEILAKQHFSTFVSYFKDHPISIGLITGTECRKFPSKIRREESTRISRAQFAKWVANGEIPIVIGTHALVYKSLQFQNLAYAIIDEQHRFGKAHRQKLVRKDGVSPHLLSMTATPIPRTLALTIYGDLDISLLDEMPRGRKPVITEVLGPEKREVAYERVRNELAGGHQAYVICPRIDEPDPTKELALQAKSVKAEAERLRTEVFPDIEIDILHSKMTPREKEEAMERFEKNETQILVATSVVEVGVNVPNATVILIEGAERFGLAQLHQLRGRVIRSSNQAYCFALPESYGQATKDRLKAFVEAKNGFELAEYDLALRGAGELTGSRQWGVSDIAMEALKNMKLVEAARTEAATLIREDAELKNHPVLARLARETMEHVHPE
ncbi:MAG: ATP-dependent DNA helicase RecG [Bacillota bacterium]